MSSTIGTLSLQLQKNPQKLTTILPQILDSLLKSREHHEQKYKQIQQIAVIFLKIITKLDSGKQKMLSQFMCKLTLQFVNILLYTVVELQVDNSLLFSTEVTNVYETIQKIVQGCHKVEWRHEVTSSLLNFVWGEVKVSIENIKSGYLLYLILRNINQTNIHVNHLDEFQNLLLHIQNFKLLEFSPNKDPDTNRDYRLQFKQIFQQLFIKCLESLENTEGQFERQTMFYNKLGDKVFSKLANPLVLSQFLIRKFVAQDQNPSIQIEILSCLFILVGKYGLQLEKFYQNLEKMISKKRNPQESIFRLTNSKRFLKLIEAAMRTSKIPFKNILTLSHLLLNSVLNQPSELIFWFLSFFVNLVKKHRQLQQNLTQFPELECLKHHYSPMIRSLIKQLQKNLNKAQYLQIEDFAKVNCQKLCDKKLQQIKKKIEQSQERLEFRITRKFEQL